MFPQQYLVEVELKRDQIPSFTDYPFSLDRVLLDCEDGA